ncbi:MAG: right-handed parallel beta-helix repeat-containing protein, partial [Paracoccus sp. (in: a-proteobacteria)]
AIPGGARIRPPPGSYSTLHIRGNHIIIDGFDIVGGTGHAIDAERVHNTIVRNTIAHDSGGSGISFYLSEFQLIEDNLVYGNAGTNPYQTSGISVASNIDLTGDTQTDGFRTIIRRNISHDNVTLALAGDHTDGNGIIIDWLRNDGTGHPPYLHPTLVEDNLVYRNGSKGIQIFMSDNVTVRNNTAWHNNRDLKNPGDERGEITVTQSAAGCVIENNIAVADPAIHPRNSPFSLSAPSVTARHNLAFGSDVALWNGARFDAAATNMTGLPPRFVGSGACPFRLRPGSPAINAGYGMRMPEARDLSGARRVVDTIDIGAFEHDPARPDNADQACSMMPRFRSLSESDVWGSR